ncbi:malto-oligosyltrehalose synthase [Roseospira visakhapatnamensis]|uniref:(1->4)-alpha-D-glucan 1-alpha-D-glucosylmutase n=1 Tax=Roseospira visakhapatnamensis TaxID=390880 RepID=A0A7W6RDK9_9PROT|nr:malto-oligosyltrehalose synthase [Roseospira visakhapatnamensis]MBB4266370.1 (1->4)-alpha-D-glucan 1-alpha-D-glucosylmutase [Roseospira visakhapatnamensis]
MMSDTAPAPTRPVRADGAGPSPFPRATLRLQLTPDFGFDRAAAVVPTLAALGVSHVYLSPIHMARPGSTHGYDIIDHGRLNPDLGGEAAFRRFSDTLQVHGLGLIVDVVPNHMGIGVGENQWWRDVLEWGRDSPYADWFDIDWEPAEPSLSGRILLPVLGDHFGAILDRGELRLGHDADQGGFVVRYYEHAFPVAVRDYGDILRRGLTAGGIEKTVLALVIAGADSLKVAADDDAARIARRQVAAVVKSRLVELLSESEEARAVVAAAENAFAGEPGRPASFDALDALMERQAYRPAFWRVAAHEINYRRFFEINDLAALRMERDDLFVTTHRLLLDLVAEGRVQGVRLDHVDGLWDPATYFRRLQADLGQALARGVVGGRVTPYADADVAPDPDAAPGAILGVSPFGADQPMYVVVEKILAPHERLRADWPIAGSTGYEFMNHVLGLFIDPAGEEPLDHEYARVLGAPPDFETVVRAAKRQVMEESLTSEVGVMANRLTRLAKTARGTRDYSRLALRSALINVVTHFPVYRTYVSPDALTETLALAGGTPAEAAGGGATEARARIDDQDRRDLQWAIGRARKMARAPDLSIYDFLHDVLTADLALAGAGHAASEVLEVAMRVQQLTGPVMAKAMEDTAFYRYVRLAAINEVGGEPERFGLSPAAFHHANQERRQDWPFAMLASATHDHKRGEDARVRLAVISECPDLWAQRVRRWQDLNQRRVSLLSEQRRAPSANDEYLFYQTLLASWPLDLARLGDAGEVLAPDPEALVAYVERVAAYMNKAVREAKEETAWTAPDAEYEAALDDFVRSVLSPALGTAFLADMATFVARLAPVGAVNGLAQTTLKLTVPGVPDLYQGTDFWDFSLVDPDNRRPVDFATRADALAAGRRPKDLLACWRDGRVKQALIAALLDLRRRWPRLFAAGEYRPLEIEGPQADRLVAFARLPSSEDRGDTSLPAALVVVVPRLVWPLMESRPMPLPDAWDGTRVRVPEDDAWAGGTIRDGLDGLRVLGDAEGVGSDALAVDRLLASLPVSVVVVETA